MSDDMSNPARRAARIRMRENAQRTVASGHEWEGLTDDQRLQKAIENQDARERARPGAALDRHFERTPLLTGFEPAQKKEADKLAQAAARFEPSDRMERLLKWKAADDPRFDTQVSAAERMALGYYEADKAAAKEANVEAASDVTALDYVVPGGHYARLVETIAADASGTLWDDATELARTLDPTPATIILAARDGVDPVKLAERLRCRLVGLDACVESLVGRSVTDG